MGFDKAQKHEREKRHRFTPMLKKFFGYPQKDKTEEVNFALPRVAIENKVEGSSQNDGDTVRMPVKHTTPTPNNFTTNTSEFRKFKAIPPTVTNPNDEINVGNPSNDSQILSGTFSQLFSGPIKKKNALRDEVTPLSSATTTYAETLPKAFSIMQQRNYQNANVTYSGEIKTGMESLNQENLRDLLISHVSKRMCWSETPAETWPILSVQTSTIYVGTIEAFVEKRTSEIVSTPFMGGFVDDRRYGRTKSLWDVDLPFSPPPDFVAKEFKFRNPHTEKVADCAICKGTASILCPSCSNDASILKEDSNKVCKECDDRKLVICKNCAGKGKIVSKEFICVSWSTLSFQEIHNEFGEVSLPKSAILNSSLVKFDIDIKRGNLNQSLPPVQTKLVETLLAKRKNFNLADMSVVAERHVFQSLPAIHVTMGREDNTFDFFALGKEKEIYVGNYPYQTCGFCLDWLEACSLLEVAAVALRKVGVKI